MNHEEARRHYPGTDNLLAAYFHEDWPDDFQDWPDVVAEFVRVSRPAEVEAVMAEIDQIIDSEMTEDDIHDLLKNGIHAGIIPRVIGLGNREWLQQLRDELQGASRAIRQPPASRA